jgi:hypothetical protein
MVAEQLAMIRGDEDQRVLRQPLRIQCRPESQQLVVDQTHHRVVVGATMTLRLFRYGAVVEAVVLP